MVWVRGNLKDHLVPNPLLWTGVPATLSGCLKPNPTWPGALPGREHKSYRSPWSPTEAAPSLALVPPEPQQCRAHFPAQPAHRDTALNLLHHHQPSGKCGCALAAGTAKRKCSLFLTEEGRERTESGHTNCCCLHHVASPWTTPCSPGATLEPVHH